MKCSKLEIYVLITFVNSFVNKSEEFSIQPADPWVPIARDRSQARRAPKVFRDGSIDDFIHRRHLTTTKILCPQSPPKAELRCSPRNGGTQHQGKSHTALLFLSHQSISRRSHMFTHLNTSSSTNPSSTNHGEQSEHSYRRPFTNLARGKRTSGRRKIGGEGSKMEDLGYFG